MKFKTPKLLCTVLAAFMLFICSTVKAQSVHESHLRFGLGVEGLLPVGNASQSINPGIGITPRLQYGLTDSWALTFTTGLYHFFPKTITIPATQFSAESKFKNKSDVIPVKIGAKYFFCSNFYLSGEVGAGFEVGSGQKSAHFLYSPGLGYASKNWDIGVRYENYNGNDGIVGLRVAYGFGL